MASATRAFARALRSSVPTRTTTPRFARFIAPTQPYRQQSRRGYATNEDGPDKFEGNPTGLIWGAAALLVGAAGYGVYTQKPEWFGQEAKRAKGVFQPTFDDYQKVYDVVAKRLEEHDEYDDGSYGPVLLRLAWHASGTYDALTGTGGSNGATMRFAPEGDHGANAGLKAARDFLEPVKGTSAHPLLTPTVLTRR
jgi:cytochrome c peroxidase